MPRATDRPGEGTYKCTNCGQEMTIEKESDQLPPCPSCGNNTFNAA
ncbi:zinc ribbon-containing protein [Alkalihalobacillus sp. CinArs1]|nr:hypothetical protein [Alkalihalobacillus sp. CinArs1]